jgi:hypothetical protein
LGGDVVAVRQNWGATALQATMTLRAGEGGEALHVPAGVVVLHYLADPGAPAIRLSGAPENSVRFLAGATDAAGIVLAAGSPGVALQSLAGGVVSVSLDEAPAQADTVIRLDIETLVSGGLAPGSVQGPRPVEEHPAGPAVAKPLVLSMPVDILAHVSRRGDLLVEGGGWVCGPELPMAIEGIELRLHPSLSGLEIMSSAIVNLRGRKVTASHPVGSFVGTRGRATPLLGVTFALAGALADQYILRGEALFLGAAIVARAGRRITLASSGGEPLLGLRLSVERLPQAIAAPDRASLERTSLERTSLERLAPITAPAVPASPTAIPAPESSSRVRVFRASAASAPVHSALKSTPTDRGSAP